jgi:hypothetical protein
LLLGLTSNPIVVAQGASSKIMLRRFWISSALTRAAPVTLPPGRLKLATKPSLTGSLPVWKTIGIVGRRFCSDGGSRSAGGGDHSDRQADQFGGKCRQSIVLVLCPAVNRMTANYCE